MFRTLPLRCPAYQKTWLRLRSLEKCLELGDEPYPEAGAMIFHSILLLSACFVQDLDVSTDLKSLRLRVESVRRELWSHLPADMDDEHLEVRDSCLGVAIELEISD